MGTGVGEAMLISAATGAAVGGGTAALTGGDPLKGALLGGLTGGAGAGIGGALGGQAASAAGSAAGSAGSAAGSAGLSGIGTLPSNLSAAAGNVGAASSGASGIGAAQGLGTLGESMASPALSAAIPPPTPGVPAVGLGDMFGSSNPALQGMGFMDKFGHFAVQNPGQVGMGAGALAGMMSAPGVELPGEEEYDGPLSRFRYSPAGYRPAFAQGGGIADLPAGKLGSYSDGGQMIAGPGDGMSDDIPAVIGDTQPARLTDGEFVVPADVVSGLGNGSTDAGARVLYDMMARVREARTGRREQAPEIEPDEVMGFADGGAIPAGPAYSIPYTTAPAPGAAATATPNLFAGASGQSWGDMANPYYSTYGGDAGMSMDDMRRADMMFTQDLVKQQMAEHKKALEAQQNTGQNQQQARAAEIEQMQSQLAQLPGYAEQRDYTATARPGYQEFGPSGQFYQPIYKPEYENYARSPEMYSPGYDAPNPFRAKPASGARR